MWGMYVGAETGQIQQEMRFRGVNVDIHVISLGSTGDHPSHSQLLTGCETGPYIEIQGSWPAVIAALTQSFWQGHFDTNNFKLLGINQSRYFPHKPQAQSPLLYFIPISCNLLKNAVFEWLHKVKCCQNALLQNLNSQGPRVLPGGQAFAPGHP